LVKRQADRQKKDRPTRDDWVGSKIGGCMGPGLFSTSTP
jgi:hypothetical protein